VAKLRTDRPSRAHVLSRTSDDLPKKEINSTRLLLPMVEDRSAVVSPISQLCTVNGLQPVAYDLSIVSATKKIREP